MGKIYILPVTLICYRTYFAKTLFQTRHIFGLENISRWPANSVKNRYFPCALTNTSLNLSEQGKWCTFYKVEHKTPITKWCLRWNLRPQLPSNWCLRWNYIWRESSFIRIFSVPQMLTISGEKWAAIHSSNSNVSKWTLSL